MRIKKIILSINSIVLSFLLANPSWADIYERTLDNGLKVVVKEDHRAPVATAQVWYKVGSASEYGGITGVSHALEHMMFKGTPKNPIGKFSELLASIGARDNAFTGKDYTAYYQIFDSSKIITSLDLESDRMAYLTLDESEFTKEIEVIKEERRLRTDDNPNALVYEQLNATAFNVNPYHNPVIGWMNDLHEMQVSDLRSWYQDWYTPNNATLVVVGDVNPEEVFTLAKKYYGAIPARDIPQLKSRVEPSQVGERRVEVRAIAKLPYIIIGYKVPSLKTAIDSRDAYALHMLAGVLDAGRSSRLSKNLVRNQEVAASAGAGYNLYSEKMNIFLFDGTPSSENNLEDLELAIYAEIKKLKESLVSEQELDRVKSQIIASEVYQQDSIQRQAYIIGSLETIGLGWKVMNEYAENIRQITARDIRDVAKKYLINDHKTVAILTPTKRKIMGPK